MNPETTQHNPTLAPVPSPSRNLFNLARQLARGVGVSCSKSAAARALLGLGLLAAPADGFSSEDSQPWELRPEVQVESGGIYLDQLVAPQLASSLPQVRLAASPALGQSVSITRDQIVVMAQKLLPDLAATNFSGATQIRVSRRTRSLPAVEVVALLTETLQKEFVKEKGELELTLTRTWNPVMVPDEPLTVRVIDLPASGVAPNFIVPFEIWNGKELVGTWRVAAQSRLWREIPIANVVLSRGQPVRDADASLTRRDLLQHRDAFLNFPTDDGSLEFTENVQAGMPLLNRSIKARPAVRRGKMVAGVFQDGGLNINLKVEALEDGLVGQTVRVRNPKTRRELFGKVQNEQTILINL